MKRKFKYVSVLACAALVAGLTSCSKDDVGENNGTGNGTVIAGLPTKLELALNMSETRADAPGKTLEGVEEENKIGEISLWIYDANDPIGNKATVVHTSDFTAEANGAKKIDIETTSGNKVIFVGVNLPESIKGSITSAGRDGIDRVIYQVPVNGLSEVQINGKNHFAMFTKNKATCTLIPQDDLTQPTPAENKITVQVERLVAKIAVAKNNPVQTDAVTATGKLGGSFDTDNMEYSVKQINRYSYVTRQSTDPNYGGFMYGWDYATQTQTGPFPDAEYGLEAFSNELGYKAVTEVTSTNNTEAYWNQSVNRFYTPENLEEIGRLGSNTYAVIKVKYTPQAGKVTGTPAKAGDFVTLIDAAHNTTEFYATVAEAEAAKAAKVAGPGVSAPDGWEVSGLYEEGYNYYRVYLIKSSGYNVSRNTFYRVRVNSITDLGRWRDTNPGPGGPEEPGKPIEENDTKMDVTIEVLPWYLYDVEEHNL